MPHLSEEPSAALAPGSADLFQFEWQIYQKMVHANEMHHRELAALLRREIKERFNRPFAFLDIACGDASLAETVLKGSQVRHYTGIDLSGPALRLADNRLRDAPFQVDLRQEDMVQAVAQRQANADLVWCGFSIHHLATPQKKTMLHLIRQALKPGGLFVCAEPVCAAGETRTDFVSRWEQTLPHRFQSLTKTEYAHLWRHVSTHDIPESPENWIAIGKDAGFSSAEEVFRFPGDLFCSAFRFER